MAWQSTPFTPIDALSRPPSFILFSLDVNSHTTMTKVSVSDGKLIIDVQGLDKIWTLKSRLEIPVEHISGVRRAENEPVPFIRLPGTFVPGLITAGTYYEPGWKRVFWDVHDHEKAIVIDLHDEHFSKLIIEVAAPEATIREIFNSVGTWTITDINHAMERTPNSKRIREREHSRAGWLAALVPCLP